MLGLRKFIILVSIFFIAVFTTYSINCNKKSRIVNTVWEDIKPFTIKYEKYVEKEEIYDSSLEKNDNSQLREVQILGVEEVYSEKDQFSVHMYEDEKYISGDYEFITDFSEPELSGRALSSVVTNALSEREVMGFLPYWQLSDSKVVNWLDYSKLTTVAYFGLTCYDNGSWVKDSGYTGFYSSNFSTMVSKAHQNNTQVILVVKNFHFPSILKIVTNKSGAGDKLISNIVSVLKAKNLDGVNIDFEYGSDYAASVTDSYRAVFAQWHSELVESVHSEIPGSLVSTDVFASSGTGYSLYDLTALGKTDLDYIMMMTYDYITTSCYNGKIITPMSPLYGNSGFNVSSHIGGAISKLPAGKILMGIPYYGIDFSVKSEDFSKYNARVNYPNCDGGIETYSTVVDPKFDQWHSSSTIKWNSTEKSRWYAYKYLDDFRQGYYDDYTSLLSKYDFVRSNNIGGVGIWALGYDYPYNDLWYALRDKFQKSPFVVAFRPGVTESEINDILSKNNLSVVATINSGIYRVKPDSGLSSTAIQSLSRFQEVMTVDYESIVTTRDINFE